MATTRSRWRSSGACARPWTACDPHRTRWCRSPAADARRRARSGPVCAPGRAGQTSARGARRRRQGSGAGLDHPDAALRPLPHRSAGTGRTPGSAAGGVARLAPRRGCRAPARDSRLVRRRGPRDGSGCLRIDWRRGDRTAQRGRIPGRRDRFRSGIRLPRRPRSAPGPAAAGHPRARVPAGSLAIAEAQTAIYPQASPGGWHLLGRSPWRPFDPAATPPCPLALGDRVRFVAIGREAFLDLGGRE